MSRRLVLIITLVVLLIVGTGTVLMLNQQPVSSPTITKQTPPTQKQDTNMPAKQPPMQTTPTAQSDTLAASGPEHVVTLFAAVTTLGYVLHIYFRQQPVTQRHTS